MEHLYFPPIIQNNERSASGSYFILVLAGMQDMGKLSYGSAVKPFYAEFLTSYCDIVCTVLQYVIKPFLLFFCGLLYIFAHDCHYGL